MAFLIVLYRRLKAIPVQETGNPTTGNFPLDGATRRFAGGCSVVAGALAAFWLMQRLYGHVPRGNRALVDMLIFYCALDALCFGLVGILREPPGMITRGTFVWASVSMMSATGFTLDAFVHGAPNVGRAGLVTAAVVVGLAFGAAHVLKRRRPVTDQPAVERDGAPRRVLLVGILMIATPFLLWLLWATKG
jgi:hypothetical protein